ncbi:MAG: TonB-dependent receptor [Acidaminococcales bacterium]|jgi:outer membrane receptor for ferrienterochelin and colicins|nr:TonB-dependent receptor [Acidaminococcales bacterium]
MKRKKFFAGLLGVFALGAPAVALAEDNAAEFELAPIVVTATRVASDTKEVAAAVQVITKDDMERIGAQDLGQVLRLATGIQVVGGTGKKSINIRGFDSRFSMIMVDGRRLAAEPDQLFELGRIPLANIERVEIVRGPQSALYGTEALGGVVNIITRNAKEQSFNLSLDLGRYAHDKSDTGNYDFNFQSGQAGRFRYSLYASYRDSQPLYRGPGYTYQPYGWHRDVGTRIDYDLSPTETLTLNLSYGEERTNEITFRPNPSFLRRTLDNNRRDEQSLSYTRKAEGTELFFRYYQGRLSKDVDQLNNTTGALMNSGSWVRAERVMRVLEGRLTRKINERHTLVAGAEYRPEKFRGTAVNTGEGIFYVTYAGTTKQGSTAWLDYLGLYVQDEWRVTPKFKTILALRYDDNNKFGSDFSPKLGLIYQFDDASRLKINAAKAFRSPTPNQLYNMTAGQIGNPNLRSEKANSYDLSYEKEFARSRYKITWFYNDVKNLIDISSGQYTNIDKATIQGLEAEYAVKLGKNWSWANSYALLDATNDTTHARLPNRARDLFTSRLSWDDHKCFTADFWAQLYGSYLPANDASIANQRARSYVLWNLAGSCKLNKNTKIVAGLYNIFDKRDEDTLEMGRYWHVSMRLSF